MEENFKLKAPELYVAPDYIVPPENPYERKGFAFDPSEANREKFKRTIEAMSFIKERGGDEALRMGGVLNALVAINKKYDYIDPYEAYREFFGGDIPLEQAESELEKIYAATKRSEDALGEFRKLDRAQQDEIVRGQSPNAKKRMPVYDSMGLAIANPVRDNPDYDPEKERADYEAKLARKNTWEGYLRIRNAFSPEIVRDAMRFKTAFDSRSAAADAYIDRFMERGEEYREAFISAVSFFSPELKAGFWERVKTRIGEGYTDTYQNAIDAFVAPKSEGREIYALAEEKGFIDNDGNLSEDPEKISELKRDFENAFGLNNLGAGVADNFLARKNTDVKKLFNEGKREFERRKNYRLLRDLNRSEFSYSDGEWKTFEETLVSGEYALRSLLLGFGVTALTKNAYVGITATSSMMYMTEAGDMYADLRFNGNVKERDAANIAAAYGTAATALEQLQISRFAGFFRKSAAIPKSWREYIHLGLKEGFKEYAVASADETAVEVAQSTAAFASKMWAAANADATYEERELWEEYLENAESAIKTMPIITGGMYGAGFPSRARAYMRRMGASVPAGTKAYFTPNATLQNNLDAGGEMEAAKEYDKRVKEKFAGDPEGRAWLEEYISAKSDGERDNLLRERYPDESEREDAALMLQEWDKADSAATRAFVEYKAEVSRKVKEDDQKLLNGDTADISIFEETDENGRYAVLESAIDALGMRDDVIFANTAEELSKASGLPLEAAQEQMARGGAKGFYDSGRGKIVVINPHFADGADALQTFAHEYGHRIMAKIRESDIGGYNRMCDEVLTIVGGEDAARGILPAAYSERGSAQYIEGARAVAEEILMRVAERVATRKVLDAQSRGVWTRFKRWFKGLFEVKSLADMADERLAQIALDVLQRERRFDVNLSGRPAKASKNWRAKTPEVNGAEVSGEWSVIDASELVASTDDGYDGRLQPRNRTRQASKEQTNEIALNLDPARLNDSETTDLGAPIVDGRGMVVSGNGRTMAIRQAYDSERPERAEAYREFVRRRAEELGIEIPANAKNPVLVRRVDDTGKMSMEEFAARSNKSQVAGMSVAEQAIADSRRIFEAGLLDVFFPDANGNVLSASNADFYNAFLNLVGGGEAYRNRDGSVRQNLSPRIRAAVLAAMLNPERRETVERLLDNPEGYTALINGLMQSAANLAELANKAEYDLSGELSQAVELFVEMRDKGQTVEEFAAQADMFRDAPSAETMFLLRLFEENAKSSGGISGVLRQYAAECKKIDTTTQSLFGEANPSKLEKLEEAYRHYATDISEGARNGNLRWRDTGEPSEEEIAEARRQYGEVESRYKGTPLWLKAPNGKPTNLTEEQWLQVRTPNFKRWFGDWEKEAWAKAAMDFLENTAPVSELSGGEFQKDGVRLTDKVSAYFNSIGNIARNEELGDVVLDKDTVKASMSHGIGRLKASAFMAVKDVIEKGFIFNREINWKDRGYDTAVIVAPIKIGGENYACEIVVKKNDKRNSFYLHEVEIKKTLEDMFKTTTEGAISQASKLILGKHLAEVNGKVSKAVDENGEPLVVYHGSGARFTEFKREFTGIGNDQYGSGFYFTTSEDIAKGYTERRASFNEEEKPGGESSPAVINAYLSVRNPIAISDARKVQNLSDIEISSEQAYEIMKLAPLIMDREESPLGNFYESYWEEGASDSLIRSLSQEYEWNLMTLENDVFRGEASAFREAVNKVLGYDGVQINFPNGEKHFVAWFPEQIKSATDNIGTYSENPDIRWREVSETKRAADEWANNSENVRKLTEEYLAEQKGQIVVDPDRIRAKLPNYEVSLNSDFVEAGDKVLEAVWVEALKRAPKDKPVVLLTGNPAAGKGTAIKRGLLNEISSMSLVFDAPQNKFSSVEKRVREAADAGHAVLLIQIYNDPITSWKNSLERGIGKDDPKSGKRGGGRFLPIEYFVEGAYTQSQGKVEKIETVLKPKYGVKTKYIDNSGNNPIVVSPDEAKAWDYSISDSQLKEIERITDEYRGRIGESARLRGDKKDPLAVIRGELGETLLGGTIRISAERIPGRTEQSIEGTEQSLPGESGEGRGEFSRLKSLLRQERTENPVIWASIVLAKEILLGRAITNAKIDRVLPAGKFDGTKREYAINRAREIAERYRANREKFGEDLNLGVQRAESDLYWTRDVVEEMYASFRRDGEEYGIAKQKLFEWLKEQRRRDLEGVRGLSAEELGVDVSAAIENALEKEPERAKPAKKAAEEAEEETFEASGEGLDDEISGGREALAPSSIREIIAKVRMQTTKIAKKRGMDEAARRRTYRNTLVGALRDSAKRLTYGKEREAIMKKISDLAKKGYSVIKIKDGERTGQKIDNYTLRAEHIALRIFNRGVRDTKKKLTEKFEKIVSRKGKKPSRMARDDKRPLAGAVQMRVYNIKRYSEMGAAELEAEYSAAVDKLENVEKNFTEDAGQGEVRADIEEIRAEFANTARDIKMFGNWRDKSRAEMAEGVEYLEKYIEEETEEQRERVERRKEENAHRRNVIAAALRQSKRNANKDGFVRKQLRGIVNNALPFDSILAILGEAATGKTYEDFKRLSDELVSRVARAAEYADNECFAKKERLYDILRECYGGDPSNALKRLLRADAKYERFSTNRETPNPMSLANVMQLYATALQKDYERNIFEHRARKPEEYEKLQRRIDEIELNFSGKESRRGAGWLAARKEIESIERERDAIAAKSVSEYVSELEGALAEADKKFVAALRAEYSDALPALSTVSRRVIGLPIESAGELYMPVKVDYGGGLGEGTGGVPVVPKSLSPRVSHLRDFNETADPIALYLERVRENAQFKYFSELYIELRGIFADESLQKLIRDRCGADVLKLLKESIADICSGQTKGFDFKPARLGGGLFAIAQLGWNVGSAFRQFLPGVFSWGAYIGSPAVLKNCASFFSPEGFAAAREIARSETGRRRFAVGNMQIIEEMLENPDQRKFWRLYKRYALLFNRSSDMLAIMFVGQGVYRSGIESYLKKGFSEAEAKKRAMSDMWQIAERSQASGKIHNMSAWQRRGGDLAKIIGMFSSPPQLMFSKAAQDIRRAIALGIKTPEGRAAAWNAVKTLFTVSVLVEGSYAASAVLWNALLKGYFEDDDDEYILKNMLTGPFGGLFLFGRLVDSLGTGYSPSAIPMEGLARPAQYTIELAKDMAVLDLDEALKDLDKLASSTFSPWRDLRKILKEKKK